MYPPQQPNMQPLQQPGNKRPTDEPHTPTLPPPNPAEQAGQRGSQQYSYPDPTGLTPAGASPASSPASFHSAQLQPYYGAQLPARLASPHSAYSYDASCASSPHTLGPPGTPAPPSSHPPVATANAARQGVKINDIVGQAGPQLKQQQQAALAEQAVQAVMRQEERTSTDTSMVHALNRGPF